jgi:hypothetical protein
VVKPVGRFQAGPEITHQTPKVISLTWTKSAEIGEISRNRRKPAENLTGIGDFFASAPPKWVPKIGNFRFWKKKSFSLWLDISVI